MRSVAIYAALLLGLRLFGKREVGQFTLYDLVLVLLVANAVQPAMTGPDSSLIGGGLIILTLILVNYAVGRLDGVGFLHRLFSPAPTLIIKDGQVLDARCRREGIDREELEMAVREHGLPDISRVSMGVLEPDGSISIVGDDAVSKTQRRLRRRYRPRVGG